MLKYKPGRAFYTAGEHGLNIIRHTPTGMLPYNRYHFEIANSYIESFKKFPMPDWLRYIKQTRFVSVTTYIYEGEAHTEQDALDVFGAICLIL